MMRRLVLALTLFAAYGATAQTSDRFDADTFGKQFHHETVTVRGTKMHYVTGGQGDPLVLVGGWPESWYAWRKVMPTLAQHYKVYAFDLPGQGDSGLATAYDTQTIAGYLHEALAQLGVTQHMLVGHDVGAWLAYAYAANYRDATTKLVLMDAAIPGVAPDQAFTLNEATHNKIFQFFWHSVPELPEAVTEGREQQYLAWFFQAKSAKADAISPQDLAEYTRVYSKPGYMKAGFDYYRAFFADHEQNRKSMVTKLAMPVLTIGGDISKATGDTMLKAMQSAATNVSGGSLAGCGHYLQEECPSEISTRILDFLAAPASDLTAAALPHSGQNDASVAPAQQPDTSLAAGACELLPPWFRSDSSKVVQEKIGPHAPDIPTANTYFFMPHPVKYVTVHIEPKTMDTAPYVVKLITRYTDDSIYEPVVETIRPETNKPYKWGPIPVMARKIPNGKIADAFNVKVQENYAMDPGAKGFSFTVWVEGCN
jgi:pimeloyl-ACP methyl ester carboxylesterase